MPRPKRTTTQAVSQQESSSSSEGDNDREDSVLDAGTDGGAAPTRARDTLTPGDIAESRAPGGPSRDAPAELRVHEAAARTGAGALDTERLMTTMVEAFARMQAETLRSLHHGSGPWSPMSLAAATPAANASTTGGSTGGNFAKCTARFDGASRDPDVLEAFLDAIEVYKECAVVSDEHARRGLPMLLSGDAAVWWRGARANVATWPDALARLRATYGVQKPAYRVLREVFAFQHSDSERAEVFICKERSLLVRLPYTVPNAMLVDIIYGLLNRRIRKRLPRDSCIDLDVLIEKARIVEDSINELSNASISPALMVPSSSATTTNASAAAALDRGVTMSSSGSSTTTGPKLTRNSNENSNRIRIKCTYCKSYGHDINECRKVNCKTGEHAVGNNESIRCYGCGQPGVVRSKCDVCSRRATPDRPSDLNVVEFNYLTTTFRTPTPQ